MEAATVREHAQAHGEAVATGDLRRASADLADDAKAEAGAVMGRLPKPVRGAELVDVEASGGDDCVARIRYTGDGDDVTVETRWREQDGRPKIVALTVL
ncbi:hypothetical protein BH24ACT26_BH24ACT26_09460 [soil metagenome]